MLKTDRMMEKVKGRIIQEQVRIKKFEEKKQKLQNIKYSKSVIIYKLTLKKQIKDFKQKEQSQFKRSTKEGVENWKQHVKSNPNDYHKLDDFLTTNKQKGNMLQRMKSMKKDRKKDGRNGKPRGEDVDQFRDQFKKNKIDEDKWDFGNRDNDVTTSGKKGHKQGHFGGKSFGFKGESFGNREEGNFGGRKGGKDKVRPGKVKRMIQRNKKNSFGGNKGR